MNLFRSEEHVRAWEGFSEEAVGGLLTLNQILEIFSDPYFRERPNGRYISSVPELRGGFLEKIKQVTGDHPFWRLP